MGSIAIKMPLPPGFMTTLYNNDARFQTAYLDEFPGYYSAGDAGFRDGAGYLHIMSRTDDIINVAGHRSDPRPRPCRARQTRELS